MSPVAKSRADADIMNTFIQLGKCLARRATPFLLSETVPVELEWLSMKAFSENALKVLEVRYLLKKDGKVIETPEGLFDRVATHIASAESLFEKKGDTAFWKKEFQDLMAARDFLPNTPTLANSGTKVGQLAACFVLPVEDSLEEIFDSLKLMALVQQSGGGTGFSFSHLRPKGHPLGVTGGVSSGPVSFMHIFDVATENIRQGGRRRGANMGILNVDHPDILEFVECKLDGTRHLNFNISVGATDAFMSAVESNSLFPLVNPKTGRETKKIQARELFERIAECAWRSGDPGLVFLDTINKDNPLPSLGRIEATNPCGEVPLFPYEACTLGSINLSHMLILDKSIDWQKLAKTVRVAVRFLDNVVELSAPPSEKIKATVRNNRKLGLGVMGFADMLLKMGTPYTSKEAMQLAESVMLFISKEAWLVSEELAKERGVFPHWGKSVFAARGQRVRNATCTSIAPTGTISIVAGTSAGIEPLFALAYRRHALDGALLTEVNPVFEKYLERFGSRKSEIMKSVLDTGTLASSPFLSTEEKALFVTALEVAPEHHLLIQKAFQKNVDNAVSKTINLPNSATADAIDKIYLRAWKEGLKGITVFRYGSKGTQVLELGTGETPNEREYFTRCDPDECKL